MIIETCTTDGRPQFMATHPAPSRPSRRPRGVAPSESELNVYPPRDHITVDTKPVKKTLKRPRRLSEAEQQQQQHDHFGLKKSRFATIEDARPRAQQPRKLAVAKPTNTPTAAKPETAQRQTRNKEEDTTEERVLPRYAEKASNGIKHELERLQPGGKDTKSSETRKLRSQEGTRFKSELASYFPDYDVVIGNEAAEETHSIDAGTSIIISDSNPPTQQKLPSNSSPKKKQLENGAGKMAYKDFSDSLFYDLYQAQKVDFTFLDRHTKTNPQSDPLPDSYYDIPHRRGKRLEMSIRNSEKGRAQHEKDQVARLLEGLQGHDWLKVMGVSGITESKKKEFEPAREHFIKGCQGILDKFRSWKDEEKRRKLEKDKALAEAAQEGEDESEESDGDPPDYSDVDHAAAMQLHEEAIARSAPHTSTKRKAEKRAKVEFEELPMDRVEKEFKSFYKKPHLRQAALGKQRKSGRSVSAWGHPIPEVSEVDFDLPEELKEEAAKDTTARRKRRVRRESLSKAG
ncbi:hypothetical protein VE01_09147 [Pseudogymnoascus verrucosus]|uniref:Something about silencing protein 4 domain-containing protein n=1 Tax=Pseudogymnoascus verrucosus TaxID=342668 RepID=A0A1B8GA71_9PEZI|nr:uncharacterized protein VE01_09147 [Pseudogymnoascus verrucosus]OBT92745.2 hypothetical protein VE01_09147 [Pseudogymnoascus verrucosus]